MKGIAATVTVSMQRDDLDALIKRLERVLVNREEVLSALEAKHAALEALRDRLSRCLDDIGYLNQEIRSCEKDERRLIKKRRGYDREQERLTNVLFAAYGLVQINKGRTHIELDTRAGYTAKLIAELAETVKANLPRVIGGQEVPNELYVQDRLAVLLRILRHDYLRENVGVPVPGGMTRPDFVVESLDLAIEVKLLRKRSQVSGICEQIRADVTGYREKYGNLLFVVYDCAGLSDPEALERGFARSPARIVVARHA